METLRKKNPFLVLWAVGAAFGLIFGLTYWYAWGCRKCAKTNSPVGIVLFCTAVGGVMGRTFGKDHVRPA